jgi:hypothetical protein
VICDNHYPVFPKITWNIEDISEIHCTILRMYSLHKREKQLHIILWSLLVLFSKYGPFENSNVGHVQGLTHIAMFPPGDTPHRFMPNRDVAQQAGCCVRPVIALCPSRTAGAGKEMADKHVTWRRSSDTSSPGCICWSLNSRLKKMDFVVLIVAWQQRRTWTLTEDRGQSRHYIWVFMRHDGFPA